MYTYREANGYLEFYLSEKIDLNVSDVYYMVLIRFTVTGGIRMYKKITFISCFYRHYY